MEYFTGKDSLKKFLVIYALTSVFIILVVTIYELYIDGMFDRELCLKPVCVANFFNSIKELVSLVDNLLKVGVGVVTIIGVYVALKNYITTVNTSRINIHLSHLNTFKEYLSHEQGNYPRISRNSINMFKIYNLIYPKSRDGDLSVGNAYLDFIGELNGKITQSNDDCKTGGSAFDYKKHQGEMIKSLGKLGVKMERLPRNDFYLSEGDILSLINKINSEFCMLGNKYKIRKRIYN